MFINIARVLRPPVYGFHGNLGKLRQKQKRSEVYAPFRVSMSIKDPQQVSLTTVLDAREQKTHSKRARV